MSLRVKTLLFIGATLLVLMVVLYGVASYIWLNNFTTLEDQAIRDHVKRVTIALNDDLDTLSRFVGDWSAWDDTYAFIDDHNPTYIETNLTEETFAKNQINLMLYIDLAGKLVYHRAFNGEAGVEGPVLPEWSAYRPALTRHEDVASNIIGVIVLHDRALLVASRPILTSNYSGPIRGSLIMARDLDEAEFQRLSKITGLALQAFAVNEPQLPADFQAVRTTLMAPSLAASESAQPGMLVKALNEQWIAGYTVLYDLAGKPAVLVRVSAPREIYQQGQSGIRYLMLALAVVGLFFGALTFILLDRLLLTRVSQLGRSVNEISASSDPATRVPVKGDDELATLAININDMLAALERAQGVNQRLLEETCAANTRLQELDRLKSQFLANMSHELRTPLNAVIGFSELLSDGVPSPLTTDQREYVNHIYASSQHLLALINDVLDLSKIQAGRMTLNRRFVDLGELLADTRSIIAPMLQRKQQHFRLAPLPEAPAISADPLRLKQILLNLLSNACKFTPDGGQIAVQVTRSDAGTLCFSVSDTGPGVSQEHQSLIFEEFHQASLAAQHSGTGLGLAIARRLVELHGGTIWVESAGQPGLGSTFYFTLPLPSGAEAALPERPTRILVVDDDALLIELLRTILTAPHYQVDGAQSVAHALDHLDRTPPDIILLDLLMPETNGFEFLAQLRANWRTRNIPVLVLTAKTLSTSEQDLLAQSVQAMMTKSQLRRNRLLTEVRRLEQLLLDRVEVQSL